jgi:hypothetical protein
MASYMTTRAVAERYGGAWATEVIRRQARAGLLPHLKLPGRKELLFPVKELERYEAGYVELEMVRLPNGGRICRPRK